MGLEKTPHTFNPTILREYDIRGQIGKNLSEEDAFALGLAFGTFVRRKGGARVCIGYDGRETSPIFADALTKGLNQTGIDAENIGIGPTPMLYFAVKSREADGGIMVTGSHNPSDYNGFKITLLKEGVFGEDIQELGRIATSGNFEDGEGSSETIDIQDAYVDRMLQDFTGERPLKIGWDNGNGAAGEIVKRLCAKLPGEHILLYEDIDGTFPNHHPDPTVDENLVDLQQIVREQSCDLGIAFDGDGDRIGVVDENGDILRCDTLMTIYARDVLTNQPGAPIVGDIKCSQVMFDEIERLGGQPVMWKTGHSLIKAKMAELVAPLAGELSGHISFADKYYGFDDALYCAVRLLNEVSKSDGGLSALTSDLPVLYNTPEIRFEVDEDKKFDLVPAIIENIKKQVDENITLSQIDGLRVTNEDGWWLIRPSNTQNVLSARVESKTPEGLERLKKQVIQEVQNIGYELTFGNS